MTLPESQWTQHVTRSFYSAYKILKYFPALCDNSENCLFTASQWIPSPRNCSSMKLYPIHAQQIGIQSFKEITKMMNGSIFCTVPFSPELCFSNWNHLATRHPPPIPIFVSSTQWGHMALPGIPLTALRSENCFHAESWAVTGLEITVLHYLLFNIWKQFFHIFCPLC